MNDKKIIIINLIKSFFVTYAWMNIGRLESTNILLLCIFFVCYLFLSNKTKIVGEITKAINVSSAILGVLFAVLYALFADLTGGLENRMFVAVYVVFSITGLFFMFYELLTIAMSKAVAFADAKKNLKTNPFSWKVLLINAGIVFLFCLPFLALNYPAIMTPDSLSQFGQINKTEAFVDHHPWIHTLLIGLLYKTGYAITGNVYSAIAFYSVFQMILVSFSIAYAIECFYEMGFSKSVRITLLCCFILFPYNLVYSVTMWKDIIFSMAVLVLTVTIIRLMEKNTVRDICIFVISALAMCLLRHNGYYAYIGTAVALLIVKRRDIKKCIIYILAVFAVAALCRGPVMKLCGVSAGEYVFNLHIPLQQVGRIVVEEKPITQEQENWLRNINDLNYIKAGYSTQGADTMTAWVLDGNQEYFDNHKGEFIRLWAEIGLKYPKEYLQAFLDITMGYWAPMQPQQTVFYGITANNQGLESQPLIRGPVQIKIHELLYKLYTMIPVYGFFYCMGGFFWILLIECALCIVMKTYEKMIAFLPVTMLTLTLFVATPLAADLRYSYALMLVVPYMTFYILSGKIK